MVSLCGDDFLDAAHLPILQSDLDPVWMGGRLCQDILDDALGEFAGALILFEDDQHDHAGLDVRADLANGAQLNSMAVIHARISYSSRPDFTAGSPAAKASISSRGMPFVVIIMPPMSAVRKGPPSCNLPSSCSFA